MKITNLDNHLSIVKNEKKKMEIDLEYNVLLELQTSIRESFHLSKNGVNKDLRLSGISGTTKGNNKNFNSMLTPNVNGQ